MPREDELLKKRVNMANVGKTFTVFGDAHSRARKAAAPPALGASKLTLFVYYTRYRIACGKRRTP